MCVVNKRLDEWVGEELVDVDKVQFPHKESKVSALARSSRPSSPDTIGPAPSEPRKHGSLGRKRKNTSTAEVYGRWGEEEEGSDYMDYDCNHNLTQHWWVGR